MQPLNCYKEVDSMQHPSRPLRTTVRLVVVFTLFAALLPVLALDTSARASTELTPQLLKDINPAGDAEPGGFVEFNGELFFRADDGSTGTELWKSDGTADGTVLVKDIYPGSDPWDGAASSYPAMLSVVNGKLLFSAADSDGNRELWQSDGTADGTVLLKDINPGSSGSFPNFAVAISDTLFFSATDGGENYELWKSDGTTDGTVLVKDINPGSAGSYPDQMVAFDGKLFFSANTPQGGWELWQSDSSAAGTVLFKDINPNGNSTPVSLAVVGDTLFFAAHDGTNGTELWQSDGTADGTVLLKDINPGSGSSSPRDPVALNGMLLFQADDGTNGQELWMSDGTAAGTVLLKDIYPGSEDSSPHDMVALNNKVFFRADDGTNGSELWQSDGTAAGTVLVQDINPGADGSSPSGMSGWNDVLYFAANNGSSGVELWTLAASAPELAAPTVQSLASTADSTPTWTWSGDAAIFRYKLNAADLSSGATETSETSFTPAEPLADGEHTLYVQAGDGNGRWSQSSSFTVLIDSSLPLLPELTTPNFADGSPVIAGLAAPDSEIEVSIEIDGPALAAAVVYRTTANSSGNWQINLADDEPVNGTLPAGGLIAGSRLNIRISSTDALSRQETLQTVLQVGWWAYLPLVVR